jgi:hypothetical protein
MGKQSAEKYLDELLNSVNREEKHNELMEANKDFVMELQTAMSAGVGNDFAEIEASHASMEIPYNYRMSPKAEAEFLMEFEKELEDGDYEDFLASFEEEESQPEVEIEVEDVEVRSYSEKVSEEQALMSILGDSFEDVMGATEVEAPMSVE